MPSRRASLAVTASIVLAGGGWPVQDAVADQETLLKQKMVMVERLMSAVGVDSGRENQEYQRLMTEARRRLLLAQNALQSGNGKEAQGEIDQAIRYLSRARPATKSPEAEDEKGLYLELAGSTESLLASYRESVGKLDRGAPGREIAERILGQVNIMVQQARRLSGPQLRPAIAMLRAAQRALQTGFGSVLGKDIVYTQSFDSPAEEYRYELARNKSFQNLIPIALEELKPPPEARRTVEELFDYNRSVIREAESQAARKQYAEAVKSVLDGVTALQRALQVAGLVVPGQ